MGVLIKTIWQFHRTFRNRSQIYYPTALVIKPLVIVSIHKGDVITFQIGITVMILNKEDFVQSSGYIFTTIINILLTFTISFMLKSNVEKCLCFMLGVFTFVKLIIHISYNLAIKKLTFYVKI